MNSMHRRPADRIARGRRGSALVLSLVAVATVAVLAASFTQFASSVANRQAQAVNRKRAFYVAEAGLAEAFAGLTIGKSGNVGTEEVPARFGEGLFWTTATEIELGVIRIESTGMIGSGRAVLSLVAERGSRSVASLGMFSASETTVSPGSVIDGYDSTLGAYETQTDLTGASLASNAQISLSGTSQSPTVIQGDVTPGPGQSVGIDGDVQVLGSTACAHSSTPLPAVRVPEVTLLPAALQESPYPLVIPPGSSGYEGLRVAAGSELLIQGPAVVVLGSLQVQATGALTFDTTNGPVHLYVTDALELAASSLITTTGSRTEDVLIQMPSLTADPVILRSQGQFHGVFYAPEAPVVLGEDFEVFGAMVADELFFEGAARLHFDRHLAAVTADEILPSMLSWRILDLASSSSQISADPFVLMGLDRNTLPMPDDAHQDQFLVIDYYDFSNVYHTYSGLESHFDWTVVKSVISATRDGDPVYFPRSTPKTGVTQSPGVAPVVDGPMI